jgi:hypothetical protein
MRVRSAAARRERRRDSGAAATPPCWPHSFSNVAFLSGAQEAAARLPEGGLAAAAATLEHGLRVHQVASALTAETEATMRRLAASLRAAP